MKIGLFGMLFLIMFTLKLAGPMAAVSWAIITLPLWLPITIALAGLFAVMAFRVLSR